MSAHFVLYIVAIFDLLSIPNCVLRVAAVQLYLETSFNVCEFVTGPSLHCIANAFKQTGDSRGKDKINIAKTINRSHISAQLQICMTVF